MADFFLKPGGAGLVDGSNFDNAFDWAAFDVWVTGAANNGDNLYALSGTYVTTSPISTGRDGLINNPISIIGVRNTGLQEALEEVDLPIFDGGANDYTLTVDNFWQIRNIKIGTTGASPSLRADSQSILQNCFAVNLGAGFAINLEGTAGNIIGCRASSPAGTAIEMGADTALIDSLITNSLVGVNVFNVRTRIVGNVFGSCGTAIALNDTDIHTIIGNTLYNGTIGIDTVSSNRVLVLRNIFSGFTTPARWSGGVERSAWFDFNVWHNSDTPVNVTKGPNAINADPQFVDPTLGTVEGFRVRAEVARGRGATIFTIGGITPSIFDGGDSGIGGTTDPDLSGDQLLLHDLETVVLDGAEVQNVYRMPEIEIEQEPTDGVYVSRNTEFQFPVGDFYPLGRPFIKSLIIDSDDVAYVVQTVRHPFLSDFWGLTCRSSVIADTFDLDNTVTLLKASYTKDPALGKKTTRTADATFTDVKASIRLVQSGAGDYAGQKQILEQYDIYVAEDIGQVDSGDVLEDENGKVYEIVAWRNRDRMDEFSIMACELRRVGP